MKENACWSFFIVLMILAFFSSESYHCFSLDDQSGDVFNVLDYGAVASPNIDNSKAFLDAWNAACTSVATTAPMVLIPENATFLVSFTVFNGPCKVQNINFKILGTIVAPSSPMAWSGRDSREWLIFELVNGLLIDGLAGTINGQGYAWWKQSCKISGGQPGCTKLAPTALTLYSCNNSIIRDIRVIHSPQIHVVIMYSNDITIDNVKIESQRNSPNTDGIHIHASYNMLINNSKIRSGDDCISIGDGTSNINITNIKCGPGHGISIGSLGVHGKFVRVEHIRVSDSTFIGTTNGVRIKTWQVGKGYVKNVTFENLNMQAVENSIIIDQNYCDETWGGCDERGTGVHISGVVYRGVTGTSSSDIAVNLNCSQAVPCSGITMTGIQISSNIAGKEVIASCDNAEGQEIGQVVPSHCLVDGVQAAFTAFSKYH